MGVDTDRTSTDLGYRLAPALVLLAETYTYMLDFLRATRGDVRTAYGLRRKVENNILNLWQASFSAHTCSE